MKKSKGIIGRLTCELLELSDKISRLENFINSEKFYNLVDTDLERSLLKKQLSDYKEVKEILELRITL